MALKVKSHLIEDLQPNKIYIIILCGGHSYIQESTIIQSQKYNITAPELASAVVHCVPWYSRKSKPNTL